MTCPYKQQPPAAWWKETVSGVASTALDTQQHSKFKILPEHKVATAGSCFAQRLAHALQQQQFNYFSTEPGPAFLPEKTRKKWNYGVYSARYGNVYSTAQLLQLLQRAFGEWTPEPHVLEQDGRFYDPFRPYIQPQGFATVEALLADQQQHLQAVKQLIEEMDVFIFTLGLTEAWVNTADGSVYPVCPGCGPGEYDEHRYQFVNYRVHEVIEQLDAAIAFIQRVNPDCKVILTVSPVPLAATMTNTGVMRATSYSKSVLRIAAEEMFQKWPQVDYFSSYEVVTQTYNQSTYYQSDKRNVTDFAVDHVMTLFFRYFTQLELEKAPSEKQPEVSESGNLPLTSVANDDVICDEEKLNLLL